VCNLSGAAGNGKGMRTDRRHVFVETRSPVGECRADVRRYRNDLLRGLVDQATEKLGCFFRCRLGDLPINVFRDFFDGEKD
jgi:hypothetical protein